ncbi:MAG TPA: ABC transporter substrate-binding protein, partial [Ktedonobacterales bacterium]
EVYYYLSGTGVELIKGSVAFNERTCPLGAATSTDTLIGKSIIIADALTLKLILAQPAAYLLSSLTYATAWAQPKQLIDKYQDRWTDHLEGFGGNLFTVKRWDHTGHFDLVRNEAFWGVKPKLREIDWALYKDRDTMWADYQAGTSDSMSSPPPAALANAKALPGFHADPDPAITYLTPHWAIAPYNDVRVRQALDLAIDRTAIAQASHGMLTPSMHMVPQGVPGYNPDLRDPAGRTGDAAFGPAIAEARTLWQSYVDEKFGGHAEQAPRVALEYFNNNALGDTFSPLLMQEWRAALPGVQVSTDIRDRARAGIDDFLPSLWLTSWTMDYPDPQDFLSLLVHTNSAYNQTFIDLPEAEKLTDQADANPDQVEQLRQYQQAEQLYVSAVAWIPLGQSLNTYLVRPAVAGYHERSASTVALAVWQRISIDTAR